MAKRYLIDTNILIDVSANRQPHVQDSAKIWKAHTNAQIDGYVAAISLTTIAYVSKRSGVSKREILKALEDILNTFTICSVNEEVLRYSLKLPGRDYEDNVQIACALGHQLDGIVTRDDKGFEHSSLAIYSPKDLIKDLKLHGD